MKAGGVVWPEEGVGDGEEWSGKKGGIGPGVDM